MTLLLWIALALVATWLIARFVLAITSLALHVVGVLALVYLAVWGLHHVITGYLPPPPH